MRRRRPSSRGAAGAAEVGGETGPGVPTAHRPPAPVRPSAELRSLPGRLEWNAALDRESARAARYGRPASVAIVELKAERANQPVDPFLPSLAGPIARAIRQDSRATDLVARVASARFQILLPETTEAGAERLAERVAANCRRHIEATGAPVTVRVSVAGTGLDDSLHEALAHALRSIEAA
ncbi:MAG TPA: diguanylate cyclase [Candidatus Limnocylindria bacterium]|nr:diguanylate cyclase [Candidatus Limnocylindria bacterium]